MRCPCCKKGTVGVSHSYRTPTGIIQRRECDKCMTVVTSTVVIVNIDPPRGQGARALAKLAQKRR